MGMHFNDEYMFLEKTDSCHQHYSGMYQSYAMDMTFNELDYYKVWQEGDKLNLMPLKNGSAVLSFDVLGNELLQGTEVVGEIKLEGSLMILRVRDEFLVKAEDHLY